jgi:microcompartment protein CcmL/EutN
MRPAIVLLEFDSIAIGVLAGDAMAKRAPISTLHAGTVHPGKYLVLAGGEVAHVEEARTAGRAAGGDRLIAEIFLAEVHPAVIEALAGHRQTGDDDAVGIVETRTVAATIGAADAGVKGAHVALQSIRLADGLGGKGYCVFSGEIHDVEEAVAVGVAQLRESRDLVARVVIPRLHEEMRANLHAHPEFHGRVSGYRSDETSR